MMNLVRRVSSAFDMPSGDILRAQQIASLAAASQEVSPREHYRLLRSYYDSNGLYDVVNRALREAGNVNPAMKPLRNPTFRIVEFYSAHLWPGALPEALPIDTEDMDLKDAIEQVWKWSNWTSSKQVAARYLALYGDLFLRVAQTADGERVYMQVINPEDVSDFDVDARGFITYIRTDVPRNRRLGTRDAAITITEIWDKEQDRYRRWEKMSSPFMMEEDRLGTPDLERSLMQDFGIDFIPIVHGKFRDVGGLRGQAAIMPVLDKVDEANRQATRLAQIMFRYNKPTLAIMANQVDAAGRPMPTPSIQRNGTDVASSSNVTLNDEDMLELPGRSSVDSLVPDLKYADFLAMLNAMMDEIREDSPELLYYQVTEKGDLSGRAVRFLLGAAIKRVEEARGEGEGAMVRAQQMAITLGQRANLEAFTKLGSFESGALDHYFKCRPVIPEGEDEQAAIKKSDAETAQILVTSLGVPADYALKDMGYTEDDLLEMTQMRANMNDVGGIL